jgi:predicted amidohydrolase
MLSEDPADLFCQLYDELSDRAMAQDRAWRRKPVLDAFSAEVRGLALDLDLDPGALEARLQRVGRSVGELDAARWAAARGLDEALATCHPLLDVPARRGQWPPLERRIRRRYRRSARFDTGAIPGALLPKFAETGRRGEQTANRAQAFAAVHRVPAAAWASPHVDFERVRSEDQPPRRVRAGHAGIVVACAAMLESLDELDFEHLEEDGEHFFAASPMRTETAAGRIRSVLQRMDESGVMLGICPELSLSEHLLEDWQRAVRDSPARDESSLEWIFLGSGPFDEGRPGAPYNRGLILNRKTGHVVHAQDKLFPFTLMPPQIRDWGLGHLFPTRVDERMTRGEKLFIRETAWGRLAILICEDLAKLLEPQVGPLIADFGVSLLIAPVFSKEVKAFFWEHQGARAYADQLGTVTIVANSLVIPRAAGQDGDVGTCLVNAPDSFEVGTSRHGDQISLFWVTPKAVEVPATHPVVTDPP